jgi:general secretion pathway protein E
MIGEIRDLETAQIAVQASLTGHLVLATLHTNDAASAVTRLVDMGVEPFLLASTLRGVLAQRLVRKPVHRPAAAPSRPADAADRELLGAGHAGPTLARPRVHGMQPYRLRRPHRHLRADGHRRRRFQRLIHTAADEAELRAHSIASAAATACATTACASLPSGCTSAEELLRVTRD